MATQKKAPAAEAWIHVPDAGARRQKGHQPAALQGQAPTGRVDDGLTSERRIRQTLGSDQRIRRNGLELELARLRSGKKELEDKEYYNRLEKLLLEMGRIYFPVKQQDQTED